MSQVYFVVSVVQKATHEATLYFTPDPAGFIASFLSGVEPPIVLRGRLQEALNEYELDVYDSFRSLEDAVEGVKAAAHELLAAGKASDFYFMPPRG